MNAFDVLCVRRVHAIDDKPAYGYKPKFGTRQFSEELLDWMLDEYKRDGAFFEKARETAGSPK